MPGGGPPGPPKPPCGEGWACVSMKRNKLPMIARVVVRGFMGRRMLQALLACPGSVGCFMRNVWAWFSNCSLEIEGCRWQTTNRLIRSYLLQTTSRFKRLQNPLSDLIEPFRAPPCKTSRLLA
ncbi:MAG: hypothetical protein EBU26_14280 [Verrucomicrobia bacterium]|nr:hypothetical protein [Verrucomicrobiota bacterium]